MNDQFIIAVADESLDDAQFAMDEYNAGYAAGGEPEFPQWAWDLVRACKRDIRIAA